MPRSKARPSRSRHWPALYTRGGVSPAWRILGCTAPTSGSARNASTSLRSAPGVSTASTLRISTHGALVAFTPRFTAGANPTLRSSATCRTPRRSRSSSEPSREPLSITTTSTLTASWLSSESRHASRNWAEFQFGTTTATVGVLSPERGVLGTRGKDLGSGSPASLREMQQDRRRLESRRRHQGVLKVAGSRGFVVILAALAVALGTGCGTDPGSDDSATDRLDVKRNLPLSWQPATESLRPLTSATQPEPSSSGPPPPIVATDGDVPGDNGQLFMIETRGAQARVTQVALGNERAAPVASWPVQLVPPGPPPAAYDVGRWNPVASTTDLFAFIPRAGQGVEVRVLTLARRSRELFRGPIPIAPPPAGVHRDYGIATWEGSRPDAFVVDRGATRDRVRVSIF